ncbi:MAG: ferrous iron transport protein B [Bacteroidaceae bacterium]|nr:ferrous iron transport protein B [Bacteroidaceae bacterium]
MRLSELKIGEKAIVVKVLGRGAFRKRIIEMGFVRGQEVIAELNAPLRDPIKFKIMDYEVSLRRSEANLIEVVTEEETSSVVYPTSHGTTTEESTYAHAAEVRAKTINIALVGNPNCGKTSLFNVASGANEHVGNYSGVTVDAKAGHFDYKGYRINIFDLPGTYSLSTYTPEELYVRRYLNTEMPDVIVNVVVASNLERNLYLTTELIDMDYSMVVALNMYDELQKSGAKLDYKLLGDMVGVPMVPTVSRTGKGIDELFDTVIDVYERRNKSVRHVHVNHGPVIEAAVNDIKERLRTSHVALKYSPRYLALKMLEGDKEVMEMVSDSENFEELKALSNKLRAEIEQTLHEDIEQAVANEKYGFISGALQETFQQGKDDERNLTRVIDSLVTNKVVGIPIFVILMCLMFEATFVLGAYPMEWIETGVAMLSSWLHDVMSPGPLKDLLIDGIIGGVGGVIVFLPNILILYLFISFMEDSGYMARAAFIMDKAMHKIGLHGKSFIPLVMGFGCNVPAIMATRSIESRSSRLITILINPFISCSARLPVYILFIGTFFPKHVGWAFIILYLSGIAVAFITAKLLRRFYFKEDETPFVMELPPYRIPTFKATCRHMWNKAEQYLRKMGGIILVASVIVWALSYYPRTDIEGEMTPQQLAEQQTNSYMGQIGQAISPVLEPLGFNWKISVALISGTAAKELIVSTLGVLYAGGDDTPETLSAKLQQPDPSTGVADFTPLIAATFLIFVSLYVPCIASITAVAKEAGSWKWGLFSVLYNTLIAWLCAFIVFRIGLLFM